LFELVWSQNAKDMKKSEIEKKKKKKRNKKRRAANWANPGASKAYPSRLSPEPPTPSSFSFSFAFSR
jgi:hypothetical protein